MTSSVRYSGRPPERQQNAERRRREVLEGVARQEDEPADAIRIARRHGLGDGPAGVAPDQGHVPETVEPARKSVFTRLSFPADRAHTHFLLVPLYYRDTNNRAFDATLHSRLSVYPENVWSFIQPRTFLLAFPFND